MAEREERLDFGVVVMPVSYIKTLTVQDFVVLSRPGVPCWSMLDAFGERTLFRSVRYSTSDGNVTYWELAAWILNAKQDVC